MAKKKLTLKDKLRAKRKAIRQNELEMDANHVALEEAPEPEPKAEEQPAPSGKLNCKHCGQPIRAGDVPVVLQWGRRPEGLPAHIGRPWKEVAHQKCDREHLGIKPRERKEKEATGTEPAKAHKAPSSGKSSKTSGSERIFKKVSGNPRKEGTHGWNSFNLIKDGMTVADYLAAGGRRNDLAWDVDHGYVELREK